MNIKAGLGYITVAILAIAVLFFTKNTIIAWIVAFIGTCAIFELTP